VRGHGFSLIELVVAMGLAMVVVAGVVGAVTPAQRAAVVEPEAADMQQRLRVAVDTLFADGTVAGAGPSTGDHPGALTNAFAPVLPFRRGHDAAGSPAFVGDAITLLSVPPFAARSTLAADLWPGVATAQLAPESGCAPGERFCRFAAGSTVLVYDDAGAVDVLNVAAVDDESGWLQLDPRTLPAATFSSGATIVEAVAHTYYVNGDATTGLSQLMRSDGSGNPDVPVVDHVVKLAFDYFGDPRPPTMTKPVADPLGPWTTYGPKPPSLDTALTGYPAGENCVFQLDAAGTAPVPRLADLGSDLALVRLTPGQLTDGPWCPDAASANRWDADLLRVRAIVVTLRVEAASAALRGPAGLLFANGGSSRSPNRWLPDVERQFIVTPRNMSGGR